MPYINNTIPYINTILKDLRYGMVNLLRWFKENSMKANPKKFQFMILGKTSRQPITLKGKRISKSTSAGSHN